MSATAPILVVPSSVDTPARAAAFGAVRTLRMLVLGAVVVPLMLGGIGGYLSYRSTHERAAAALADAVAVAEQNTTKVLDTHILVAARIDDLLAGVSDDEIRSREKILHERIGRQIDNLPQVAAAWAVSASGRELVSARVYPVDRQADQSGRDDFQALQNRQTETFIWALRARSLDRGEYQPYFEVSRRRQAVDGSFQGIIVVAVSGDYFASFYDSLLGASTRFTASIFREDGTSLAHYPRSAAGSSAPTDDLLAHAIAEKAAGGVIASGSMLAEGNVIAYRRLANYPVYVSISRTQASILNEWAYSMIGYAAIGAPAAVGFLLLSLLALRRTHREQLALAQARDAVADRAALESQLHHAQKLEAVGLLTAGLAHDFNNLLTVVKGNISLLEADLEGSDVDQHKSISAATKACDRAAALTKRLLSFVRREPIDPRPVDVNDAIAGLADLPWQTVGDRITTELRLGAGTWPVFVDPNELENALLNLALNARDAMQRHGQLTIETSNCSFGETEAAGTPAVGPGDYVVITVGDTGSGMTEAVREKAFDPFFTTKDTGKGTGLGLSQVYGFVTRFGGTCTIESEPGRGTAIKLYLPRWFASERDKDAAAREATPRKALSLPGARSN
jgi:signal transduction histidine kinase